jgi:hypothetical protein
MHDKTPPHILRSVRQHLTQTFGEQWIGHGGAANWSGRSPDLNPLDFLAVGTPECFGEFIADQQLRRFRATGIECLSGDSI